MSAVITLQINGDRKSVDADAERSLLSVLRDDLGLTGRKYGCGEGQCGACTVLHRRRSRCARASPASATVGGQARSRTIEGLAHGDKLHPLQEAFLDAGAMQCGYCTPGMIMSAVAPAGREAAADARRDRPRR